jgi:exopolyphosphatase/guanosine-5'-triphosphate,3'-diphosphate pyrophosphatase
MIVASIDIGTNTVLLLIAKVDYTTKSILPLFNDYKMPRIGRGIKQNGKINPESISKLFEVLRELKSIISRYNCERIIVSGTNAFRIAANASEIIDSIKLEFGLDVKVISGVEEAEYAYLGAQSAFKEETPLSVIDIGGSSTEIITGEGLKILSKVSLQIGSVTATEMYFKTSPPINSEIEKLRQEVVDQFANFGTKLIAKRVVAIAGTSTTLACIKLNLKEFDENLVDKFKLTKDDLIQLTSEIIQINSQKFLEKYGSVMRGREDIILAGAIILEQFMEFYQVSSVIVSTRGIRHGAIVKNLFEDTMDSNFG